MARTKPCAQCNKPMWDGAGSLPAGQAVCHPCRRKANAAKPSTPKPPRTIACVKCGLVFTTHKVNQRYCTARCRPPGHYTKASAASRGYGAEHQRRRKALLPGAYGHRCPLCYQVMLRGQPLDLDHTTPKAFGGTHGDRITHATCNRKRGNETKRLLRSGQPTRQATRAW